MPQCRWGELSGYGDLTGRRCSRWRQPTDGLAADIALMRNGDDPRLDSVMTQRPRSPILAA